MSGETLSTALTAESIAAHSTARWMGSRIDCLDSVDSTNTRARELGLAGAPDGTVVTAEEQSRGRGRLGRAWVSPAGRNVYMSILLRTDLPPESISQISLAAGLAACETVQEWSAATLKWPNDVLVGGRKVVGILAELESRAERSFCRPRRRSERQHQARGVPTGFGRQGGLDCRCDRGRGGPCAGCGSAPLALGIALRRASYLGVRGDCEAVGGSFGFSR